VTDFSKFSSFYLSNERKIFIVSYNRRCHSYNHCFSSQYTHELSALEPEGHGDESAKEVLNEIITGRKAISLRIMQYMKYRQEWDSNLEAIVRGLCYF
jgi:hypothetical protein